PAHARLATPGARGPREVFRVIRSAHIRAVAFGVRSPATSPGDPTHRGMERPRATGKIDGGLSEARMDRIPSPTTPQPTGSRRGARATKVGRRLDRDIARSRTTWCLLTLVVLSCSYLWIAPLALRFPRAGLDPSWVAVLGEAASRNIRFGSDIVSTYGPLS